MTPRKRSNPSIPVHGLARTLHFGDVACLRRLWLESHYIVKAVHHEDDVAPLTSLALVAGPSAERVRHQTAHGRAVTDRIRELETVGFTCFDDVEVQDHGPPAIAGTIDILAINDTTVTIEEVKSTYSSSYVASQARIYKDMLERGCLVDDWLAKELTGLPVSAQYYAASNPEHQKFGAADAGAIDEAERRRIEQITAIVETSQAPEPNKSGRNCEFCDAPGILCQFGKS